MLGEKFKGYLADNTQSAVKLVFILNPISGVKILKMFI